MAQEYTVKFFRKGDYQDSFGNYWCEAAFKEFGEPVRWVVKDPMKVQIGDKVYGHIEDSVSKAGKPYNRFKTDKREDDSQYTSPAVKKEWQPRDDNAIRAQWAIGQAVKTLDWSKMDGVQFDSVLEGRAKVFYAMVERVKSSAPLEVPKPVNVEEQQSQREATRDAEAMSLYASVTSAERDDYEADSTGADRFEP